MTPVALSFRRSDLLSIRQDHSESTLSFFARINGKASTCGFTIDCPGPTCDQKIDFTDIIVKYVLINGLVDDDTRRDALGWEELDDKDVKGTVNFLEAKEMARDVLIKQTTAPGISTRKTSRSTLPEFLAKPAKQRLNALSSLVFGVS